MIRGTHPHLYPVSRCEAFLNNSVLYREEGEYASRDGVRSVGRLVRGAKDCVEDGLAD